MIKTHKCFIAWTKNRKTKSLCLLGAPGFFGGRDVHGGLESIVKRWEEMSQTISQHGSSLPECKVSQYQ